MAETAYQPDPIRTALYDRHVAAGGRMVEFAGHTLPVQYRGIVAEHTHTREAASLFDVSHMGQVKVAGPDHATTIAGLEKLTPAELGSLAPGEMRYTVLMNAHGGIEDDLMVMRPAQGQEEDGIMYMVVNAGRKIHDTEYMQKAAEDDLRFEMRNHLALIALQGPKAAQVLGAHCDAPGKLGFMQIMPTTIGGIDVTVSRSGYTGEDGFEISVDNADAPALFDLLMADESVEPAGLGARDSLRLEAGLCLYGHDINTDTDPVTASLIFAVGKARRTEGGFIGADKVMKVIADGPVEKRVGITFDGRQPVREGAEIIDAEEKVIGVITSGGFSPTLGAPIAMGYVPRPLATAGTAITARVRGKPVTGTVTKMPFVPHRYVRQP